METTDEKRTYQIQPDQKPTSVMIYTESQLILGDVLLRPAIKVSTWLRTPAIPQFIHLYDTSVIFFNANSTQKPQPFHELFLPSIHVIAFHIKPPDHDPLDYEVNQPNRKMEPVSAIVGNFRLNGFIRMSTQTNLERFLDVSKEAFTSLYDVEVSQPNQTSRRPFPVTFVLLRTNDTIFSPRDE